MSTVGSIAQWAKNILVLATDVARLREDLKEIDFRTIQGEPYYVARTTDSAPVLISPRSLEIRRDPFSIESLLGLVKQANPGTPAIESKVLSEYDSYYRATEQKPPLPVLRIKFGDAD